MEKIYEFVNIDKRDTGIDNIIIRIFSEGDTKLEKPPKIHVSYIYGEFNKKNSFSVDVRSKNVVKGKVKITETEFQNILKWIKLNEKKIIKYWKFGTEMITEPFLNSLKSIQTKNINGDLK